MILSAQFKEFESRPLHVPLLVPNLIGVGTIQMEIRISDEMLLMLWMVLQFEMLTQVPHS